MPSTDYVTREAQRSVDAMLARTKMRVSKDGALYAELVAERAREYRRVLRRAAGECERQQIHSGLAGPHNPKERAAFNLGCDWSRDAIRALATGGRG